MSANRHYILIEGESSRGTQVRPHNWAERFAGNLASYSADRRLRYSKALEPLQVDGTKYLRMCASLEASDPALFRDVLGFADYYALPVHGLARHPDPAAIPEPFAKAS